ncbi:MAG: flavin monoamine oxidase family protein [Burkholderiaceae bacterium]|nr:flavin monoamine oxidase family protein [Burkholderiaceae bacterium]
MKNTSAASHASSGPTLSRREFLYRAAAVGGTGLLLNTLNAWGASVGSTENGPPALSGDGKGKTIIILGAGLAGMTAAYELGKLGYTCRILEARDFAGGRCQTARKGFTLKEYGGEEQVCQFDEGQYINHGPWRIPYNHQSTLHYTKLFQVPLEIMVNDNDVAWVYREGAPGPLLNRRVRQLEIKADMRGHVAELLAKAVKDDKLDNELTVEDKRLLLNYLAHEGHLSKNDLKYRGGEGRGFKVYPGAGTDPGPGMESDPLGFKELLGSELGNVYSGVHEIWQQATMFQPVGGMDSIAKAFEKRVGKDIRYGTIVQAIRQQEDGVSIDYRDAVTGATGSVHGDFCLCTLPLSVMGSIANDFSPQFKEALRAAPYLPVGKIGLQMKRRFWEEDDFIYGGHIRTNFQGIGDITLPSTGWQSQKGVLLGYYNFASQATEISAMSLQERTDFALAAGQKIFPSYRESCEAAFSVAWHRVPYNLGGWATWTPEARKTAYPLLWQGEGRVLLAGEHMSYLGGWQAGAIESAWQQVAKIHQRMGA